MDWEYLHIPLEQFYYLESHEMVCWKLLFQVLELITLGSIQSAVDLVFLHRRFPTGHKEAYVSPTTVQFNLAACPTLLPRE